MQQYTTTHYPPLLLLRRHLQLRRLGSSPSLKFLKGHMICRMVCIVFCNFSTFPWHSAGVSGSGVFQANIPWLWDSRPFPEVRNRKGTGQGYRQCCHALMQCRSSLCQWFVFSPSANNERDIKRETGWDVTEEVCVDTNTCWTSSISSIFSFSPFSSFSSLMWQRRFVSMWTLVDRWRVCRLTGWAGELTGGGRINRLRLWN